MILSILACLTGTAGGMGIGGGSILVVILSSFFGYEQKSAQSINIASFLPTAAASLIVHIKNKEVKIKTALIIAVSGLVSAVLLALVAMSVDSGLIKRIFGGLVLVTGISELVSRDKSAK